MRDAPTAPRHLVPIPGDFSVVARRAMLVPVAFALLVAIGVLAVGPWPLSHRLVLLACTVSGVGFIALEYFVPWGRLPALVYLPVPALGLVAIGAAMWASGGWSSPYVAFLALPTAYAVAATTIRQSVPIGVLAGLVAASPGLYIAHTSFGLTVLGTVPAYVTLVALMNVIVSQLRRGDRSAILESQARAQSEARAHDLLTLQQVSWIVASHLSMDDAINAIVHELASGFGHSLISIYLREGAQLVMQAQVGYESYYSTIEIGQGVIGRACERGETVFVRDVSTEGAYRRAENGVASEIAVALRDEGLVVGVLNVESREPLMDRDRDLMELFGAQVSVVLRNARLAGELRIRAEHDSLTGLLNYRALMESLEQTLAAGGNPCAVLLIDLNDFKQLNDGFGHLTGDEVLQHVAGILKASCRTEDHCCRYGGDEFVVLLPNAGRDQAETIAHRIEQSAREKLCRTADGVVIPLRLAMGIAVSGEDGGTPRELLASADRVMYAAKRLPVESSVA